MRVLISSLLHHGNEHVYPKFFSWCKTQIYQPSEFWILIHRKSKFHQRPDEVTELRERARIKALEWGFNALFFIDCDTIPPVDAIDRLLEIDADMATGIYFRDGYAVAWVSGDPYQEFLNDEVSVVNGAGLGCCLISSKVLEAVPFEGVWDDFPYWYKASVKGFRCRSLNTLRCHHYWNPHVDEYEPAVPHYTIRCPEGICINGVKYEKRVRIDKVPIEAIKEMDKPYRTGKIGHSTNVGGGFSPFGL